MDRRCLSSRFERAANELRVSEAQRYERIRREMVGDLYALSPREFETKVEQMYKVLGYRTKLTPATNDGGVDVFLRKDGKLYAVQCKRGESSNSIGRPALQQFYGAMKKYTSHGYLCHDRSLYRWSH